MHSDQSYMRRALALARRGGKAVRPNPMVGAVIVRDGKIVGKGWHQRFGGRHAEVEAIRDAGEKARGATMYVTLEPCNHHGKTPPCSEAILTAGITRVVVAMPDPNPDVAGGGAARLREAGVTVESGCLQEAAEELNVRWIYRLKHGKPMVHGVCALTLNGFLSDDPEIDSRLSAEFDPDEIIRIREAHQLDELLASGKLSRLIVVRLPRFSSSGKIFSAAAFSGLSLLRAGRAGQLAVSVYRR